ncbi:MAG: MMPL family transporter [Pseudomonadales bacterium]|nr:MMPL family transporter [Pseudomonadales bacterium]
MEASLGPYVIRYRWPIIILTILSILVCVYGATQLRFTNDYRIFSGDKNPQLQAFDKFQDMYGKQDSILIAVASKSGDIFTAENLGAIQELTEKAWETPYSSRVDSLANYQHTQVTGDELLVQSLYEDKSELGPEKVKWIKDVIMAEPLLVGRLISDQGHVAAVNITMNLPEDSSGPEAESVYYARQIAAELEAEYPGLETYLSGQTVLNISFLEAAVYDSKTLIPIMFGLLIFMLAVVTRSFWGTVGTLLVVAFSVIFSFGVAGYLDILQSNTTGAVPIIVLTLGVADSIHLLVSFFHEWEKCGDKEKAINEALRINFQPIFLTSLTTIFGFASLNFSESPPMQDMGNMVALGVVAAFFYSIAFLPALLSLIPLKSHKASEQQEKIMDTLHYFARDYRHTLLGVFILVGVGLGLAIPSTSFNDLFAEYFGEEIEFRRDNDFIRENLTGVMALHYSVAGNGENGIFEPEYLSQLDALGEWFKTQDKVLHIDSIASTMKRLNRTMNEDDASYYRIPDSRPLASQYMLLYEMSLPFGLSLDNTLNSDRSATRLTVTMDNIHSEDAIALVERAHKWQLENAPALTMTDAVGPSIMFSHISKRNLISMLDGMVIALLAISVVILISLRSMKLGLLSLVPNTVPIVMTYGVWAVVVGELGMSGAFVSVIVLGVIVDDTVHFLSKYLRAKRELNMNSEEAMAYAFRTVGVALATTTIILVAGFSVLTLSAFSPNTALGSMSSIAFVIALLTTYFMLPPLLYLVDGRAEKTPNMDEFDDSESKAA